MVDVSMGRVRSLRLNEVIESRNRSGEKKNVRWDILAIRWEGGEKDVAKYHALLMGFLSGV